MFAALAATGRAAAFVAPRTGASLRTVVPVRSFSKGQMSMANPKVFVSTVVSFTVSLLVAGGTYIYDVQICFVGIFGPYL